MKIFCAICNELLNTSETVATPCGHVFHFACLSQWLPRSSTCPECRRKATPQTIHKLYFNINLDKSLVEDSSVLQSRLADAISERDSIKKDLQKSQSKLKELKLAEITLKENLLKKEAANDVLKKQCEHYRSQIIEINQLKERLHQCEEKNKLTTRLQQLLTISAPEVDEMMKVEVKAGDLAIFVSVLKRELRSSEDKRNSIKSAFQESQHQVIKWKAKCNEMKQKLDNFSNAEQKLLEYQMEKNSLLDHIKELEKRVIELSKSEISSPKMKDKVVRVSENSKSKGSPYLQIESSSVGMMPLRLLQNNELSKRKLNDNQQLSIFKKTRLTGPRSMASLYPSSSRVSEKSVQRETRPQGFVNSDK